MPVSLKGSTSGDVTLTAPAVAGTNTLTLPAATGTLIYGTQPAGNLVGTTDTQTLTNKTINASQLVDASISAAKLDGSQSGSAPIYAPRAWVNFNGISDTIRSSGNVTSVIANLAGDYTVSFTTALPSADYAVSGVVGQYVNANFAVGAVCGYNNSATIGASTTKSTTSYRCQTSWATNTKVDCDNVSLTFVV